MQDFWYYGWRIRTDLPLTGLARWPGPAQTEVDLHLLRGPVPERLENPDRPAAFLSFDAGGTALLRLPGVFRLMSSDPARATIDLAPGVATAEVESYLLSYVAGFLLHRRGVLPLHASAVEIDGRAVAVAGHSGRGKSTLAAALVRAGHRLLSDDITVVEFAADGGARAIPGSTRLRLKGDAVAAHGLDPATLAPGRAHDQKQVWSRDAVDFRPVPLAALIRLDIAHEGEGPTLTRLCGPSAVLPLEDIVYRFAMGRRLGRAGDLAYAALRLAAAVPIHRLARSRDFADLPRTLELITAAR